MVVIVEGKRLVANSYGKSPKTITAEIFGQGCSLDLSPHMRPLTVTNWCNGAHTLCGFTRNAEQRPGRESAMTQIFMAIHEASKN